MFFLPPSVIIWTVIPVDAWIPLAIPGRTIAVVEITGTAAVPPTPYTAMEDIVGVMNPGLVTVKVVPRTLTGTDPVTLTVVFVDVTAKAPPELVRPTEPIEFVPVGSEPVITVDVEVAESAPPELITPTEPIEFVPVGKAALIVTAPVFTAVTFPLRLDSVDSVANALPDNPVTAIVDPALRTQVGLVIVVESTLTDTVVTPPTPPPAHDSKAVPAALRH